MNVAGMEPVAVAEPRDAAELAQIVADLYARDRAFAFAGGGTELDLGNRPRALHTLVRTSHCASVVDYAPEDQTITVQAGMTLADVNDVLARNNQFLAIDAAEPERMTVGGAIATNRFGRRRLRYGGIKDTIVGIEIVRPDGTRARGGGKVVKNVAGFDIPKLMVGSLGTLGAIVSATFRVYPVEARTAAVVMRGANAASLARVCEAIAAQALVPASVVAYDAGQAYDIVLSFEGFERGVVEQVAAALAIARNEALPAEECSPGANAAYETRERDVRRSGAWRARISAAPVALAGMLARGFGEGISVVAYPLLGAAFVASDRLDASTIAAWREAAGRGSVVVSTMPAAERAAVDAWGPPPPALALMQRVKSQFDPKGLCSSGRFVGGI